MTDTHTDRHSDRVISRDAYASKNVTVGQTKYFESVARATFIVNPPLLKIFGKFGMLTLY